MNRVILMGNATSNAEIKEGRTVARYTLAVPRYKDGTDFINCVCFGKQIDFAENFVTKGKKLLVEGRLQTGSYEKDGIKFKTADVIVEHHEFCEKKSSESTTTEGFGAINFDIPEGTDEDLPFN